MSQRVNVGQLLLQRFRWFDEGLMNALHSAGWPEITRAHSMVFANLDAAGTRTAEIARRAGVTRQAAHEVVSELRRLGLVELVDDTSNRSAKLVIPTARGRENVRAAIAAFERLEEELAQRIGPRRVAELRGLLEQDWGSVPCW